MVYLPESMVTRMTLTLCFVIGTLILPNEMLALAKAPIFTEVSPGGNCPNGAWSVVEDTDGDGCHDHVQGRNSAGEVVDASYSDADCMLVPHHMGPFTGVVSGGSFTNASSYWQISLYNGGIVRGYMRKVNGIVSTEWVQSLMNGNTPDNPTTAKEYLEHNPTQTSIDENGVARSSVNGSMSVSHSPGNTIAHDELVRVHNEMTSRLMNTSIDANVSISVTAKGTVLGAPTSFDVVTSVSAPATVELINLTTSERKYIKTENLVVGAQTIPFDAGMLASGAYVIVVRQGTGLATANFTIVR